MRDEKIRKILVKLARAAQSDMYDSNIDDALSAINALNKIDEDTLITIIHQFRMPDCHEHRSCEDLAKSLIQRKDEWLGCTQHLSKEEG